MDELAEYLRSRHVDEEAIQRMEQDKIDPTVIKLMSDEELKDYLPSYGDRIAVFGHCRRQEEPSRKSKLFERLKLKFSKNQNGKVGVQKEHGKTSIRRKSDRKVELGWLNFRKKDNTYVHMRTKNGGGTRKESVPKKSTNINLIEKALELFFPGGENVHGKSCDFEVDLTDFQETPLPEHITVEEMYEMTKLPVLRFYLKTKKRQIVTEGNPEESNAESDNMVSHSVVPHEASSSSTVLSLNNLDVIHIATFYNTEPLESNSSLDIHLEGQESTLNLNDLDESGIVTVRSVDHLEMEAPNLEDTLPLIEEELPIFLNMPENNKTIIVVHRGQILQELIQVFSNDEMMNKKNVRFKVILPDGNLEKALDDGGVVRDVLSEFWQDFYEQCTMGSDFKVPYLRHDFGKEEWESVGRIIAFGWKQEKQLPIKLAPVILEQAILGDVESDLLDSFLKYVSHSERVMFQTCFSDFESIDENELLEVLDLHNCRRHPTSNNIEQIIRELAHKKLIQEPAFVIEQWSTVLVEMKSELKGIAAAYDALQPTSRKIMQSLTYPTNQNASEKQMVKYVNTYLRECDMPHLSRFLRFCTGSDVFTGKDITVSFTMINGLQRRPVAHTCGCYLELPVTYESYPDFRHEMNKILESNIWVMDIV
ncbi:uncharacterized protein LOC129456644 [Periophthalmus magnuspinnatus]|uniref:uncharacterized protein LOC117378751 n=1 Tax=Periophthalmus magnuspinnatus TaxID=409849 RepID=UPI00145BBF54|nr:uncharacterized protein LOC117378751 [Periophthalmus magnuspinnatus]XP_033833570.1 uncharacterized protein LOC117380831 [Periophthalmus magnuspinnatus]XP_055081179.1 uncharacterized protein LOC129456644 [Periophthalmus magnuspinnatus]